MNDIADGLTLSLQKSDNVLFVDLNTIINQLEYLPPTSPAMEAKRLSASSFRSTPSSNVVFLNISHRHKK